MRGRAGLSLVCHRDSRRTRDQRQAAEVRAGTGRRGDADEARVRTVRTRRSGGGVPGRRTQLLDAAGGPGTVSVVDRATFNQQIGSPDMNRMKKSIVSMAVWGSAFV